MTKMKTKTAKNIDAKTDEAIAETENFVLKARDVAKKGAYAYVGLFGLAFERAQKRYNQITETVSGTTDSLMTDLVTRGEVIEAQATTLAKEAQVRATKTINEGSDRIAAAMPTGVRFSNDRVAELEAEVEALNKKVRALSRKATKPAKMTTKTVKKTPAKSAAKTTAKPATKAAKPAS